MKIPDLSWNEGKMHEYADYLRGLNDGKMDVEAFLHSEYGKSYRKNLNVRFAIEGDEAAQDEYFDSIGLNCRRFETEDYYTRWFLLFPKGWDEKEPLPLLFWQHGGNIPIEEELSMTGYPETAGKERFLVVYAQNTNWQNTLRILDILRSNTAVDEERVYLAGFSQGGQQVFSTFTHVPWRFAGAATTGTTTFLPHDCQDFPYTETELSRLKDYQIPLYQMCGAREPFHYAPLNFFVPPTFAPSVSKKLPNVKAEEPTYLGRPLGPDPTRIYRAGAGIGNALFESAGKVQQGKMSSKYNPPEGLSRKETARWCVNKVNRRLSLLSCVPRDVEVCVSYLELPEETLHRTIGIYGDHEMQLDYQGIKHSTAQINDVSGKPVFSFTVVDNFTHCIPITMGEWSWAFLKHYHRDRKTGKLIYEG